MDDEVILASAARFLVDGGEEDAASVLISCEMSVWYHVNEETRTAYAATVGISGPRAAYDVLSDSANVVGAAIKRAVRAVLPAGLYQVEFEIGAQLVELDRDWRSELLDIARGRGVQNQAASAKDARTWHNLRFRSQSEIHIAVALERAAVLFLPNCLARLGAPDGRQNREADFLVCRDAKWGILEVDGEPFHPPSRTVADHERDRLFKQHGIRVVEHYDASRCYERPDEVVAEFLALLARG